MLKEIVVPDIGAYSQVPVIEVLVKVGDTIAKEAALITLETEKATMEIPSPFAGVVKDLKIKLGDKVSKGDVILMLEVEGVEKEETEKKADTKAEAKSEAKEEAKAVTKKEETDRKTATKQESPSILKEIKVPDIGAYSQVPVIEVLVRVGESIAKETALITLETEKATMEIPSPFAGVIKDLKIKVGDKVSQGDVILSLETETSGEAPAKVSKEASEKTSEKIPEKAPEKTSSSVSQQQTTAQPEIKAAGAIAHAGPGVRRFARELGVDLSRVTGTGRNNRILQTDVQQYVKNELKRIQSGGIGTGAGGAAESSLGFSIPPWPELDYAQFGPITKEPLSRIQKLSGTYLHRNWIRVPHVTQFDEADITELEQFRKDSQSLAEEGVKLTPLVFIMKAVTAALQAFPNFNSSLDANGTELILKKYFHIGVAVDTPNGLVVPVVRDVDQKGLFQLAKELGEISQKARKGQLKAQDMQGSSFSISSLGGIGGTAFTPIINVPDVAILGVSRAQMKPIYKDNAFVPRLMLPLSLSYDHRVIDGADAARFSTFLSKQLTDIRRLLL